MYSAQFKSEKGALHLIVLILILVGIAVGVYLISSKSNFFTQFTPKAGGAGVFWLDSSGKEVEETTETNLKLKLVSPWSPSVVNEQLAQAVINKYAPSSSELASLKSAQSLIEKQVSEKNKKNKTKNIVVWGKLTDSKGNAVNAQIIDTCTTAKANYVSLKTLGRYFYFIVPNNSSYCVKASDISGYTKDAVNSRVKPATEYVSQIAGVDCAKGKNTLCNVLSIKNDRNTDSGFDFVYTTSQSSSVTYQLSESPNFTTVTKEGFYITDPTIIDYPVKGSGKKLIYARFKNSNGEVSVYSDSINVINTTPSDPNEAILTPPKGSQTPNAKGEIKVEIAPTYYQNYVKFALSGKVEGLQANKGYIFVLEYLAPNGDERNIYRLSQRGDIITDEIGKNSFEGILKVINRDTQPDWDGKLSGIKIIDFAEQNNYSSTNCHFISKGCLEGSLNLTDISPIPYSLERNPNTPNNTVIMNPPIGSQTPSGQGEFVFEEIEKLSGDYAPRFHISGKLLGLKPNRTYKLDVQCKTSGVYQNCLAAESSENIVVDQNGSALFQGNFRKYRNENFIIAQLMDANPLEKQEGLDNLDVNCNEFNPCIMGGFPAP